MRIHLLPAITDNRVLDRTALRGLMAASLPVGRCGCGGMATALDVSEQRRVVWLTLRCNRCHGEAAMPCRYVPTPPATAPAEQATLPFPRVTRRRRRGPLVTAGAA